MCASARDCSRNIPKQFTEEMMEDNCPKKHVQYSTMYYCIPVKIDNMDIAHGQITKNTALVLEFEVLPALACKSPGTASEALWLSSLSDFSWFHSTTSFLNFEEWESVAWYVFECRFHSCNDVHRLCLEIRCLRLEHCSLVGTARSPVMQVVARFNLRSWQISHGVQTSKLQRNPLLTKQMSRNMQLL